jgi:cellulose synthase/poly-beta-1,6-N-acetylglucosamine synthase-like glycosyltransferase
LIWFFGIRFANFIYDVIYHTLALTKAKTSKIIAYSGKIIILFFTLMLFLDYTKIVSDFIINTILIGFVSMLSLAWWLAFGLWGKEIAQEILESFRK